MLKRSFHFIVLLNRVYFYLYLTDSVGLRSVFRYDLVTTEQHFSSTLSQLHPFGALKSSLVPYHLSAVRSDSSDCQSDVREAKSVVWISSQSTYTFRQWWGEEHVVFNLVDYGSREDIAIPGSHPHQQSLWAVQWIWFMTGYGSRARGLVL